MADPKILVHDDGNCKGGGKHTPLLDGYCPACGFHPDAQSTAYIPMPQFIEQPNIFPVPENLHFSVGKRWQENQGRRRTAVIVGIDRLGFSQMPPVHLAVEKAEDGKPVRRRSRVAGWGRFLREWSPVEDGRG